jgi:hypothetical protein
MAKTDEHAVGAYMGLNFTLIQPNGGVGSNRRSPTTFALVGSAR